MLLRAGRKYSEISVSRTPYLREVLTVGVLGRTHFLSEKISWTRFLICTRLAHIIWLSELIIGKPPVNYGSPKIIKSQN